MHSWIKQKFGTQHIIANLQTNFGGANPLKISGVMTNCLHKTRLFVVTPTG